MYDFLELSLVKNLLEEPILFIIFNVFFIIATYTDIKWMKIYNVFNFIMLLTRIFTFFVFGFSWTYLIGGALMFCVVLFGAVLTNAQIGGDIKFSGNIGLWLGFMPSALVLALSLVINLIFRKFTKNVKAIALAPFLYIAFLIVCAVVYFEII